MELFYKSRLFPSSRNLFVFMFIPTYLPYRLRHITVSYFYRMEQRCQSHSSFSIMNMCQFSNIIWKEFSRYLFTLAKTSSNMWFCKTVILNVLYNKIIYLRLLLYVSTNVYLQNKLQNSNYIKKITNMFSPTNYIIPNCFDKLIQIAKFFSHNYWSKTCLATCIELLHENAIHSCILPYKSYIWHEICIL